MSMPVALLGSSWLHNSVQDEMQNDLKHDEVPREAVQNCISPQPEVDLEDDTEQEDIS